MKTFKIFAALAVALLTAAGCQKEKDPVPGTNPERIYNREVVAEQWADYPELQEFVLDFFDKTSTMILIDYTEEDIWWSATSAPRRVQNWDAPATNDVMLLEWGYEYLPVNKDYLAEQLQLLKDEMFAYFSIDDLRRLLPQKIYLTEKIGRVYIRDGEPVWYNYTLTTNPNPSTVSDCYPGNDYLAFSWGGPEIDAMTPAQRAAFRASAVGALFWRMVPAPTEMASLLPDFFNVSVYQTNPANPATRFDPYTTGWNVTGPMNLPNRKTGRDAGIIVALTGTIPGTWKVDRSMDFSSYVSMALGNSWETLTAEVDPSYGTINFTTQTNFLHPTMDATGRIRQKYDFVIDYYKTNYGFDLQTIGNGTPLDEQ